MCFLIELIVQLGEEDVLLDVARVGAKVAYDKASSCRALCRGNSNRAGCGAVGVSKNGSGGHRRGVQNRVDLAEAVIGEEVEQLVLDDGTAYRATELLLLMHGWCQQERVVVQLAGVLGIGIQGVERRIAQVVEGVAVHHVAARLGDGVDDAACSLTKLRRVARS